MDSYNKIGSADMQNLNWEEFSGDLPVWNVTGDFDKVIPEKEKEEQDDLDLSSFLDDFFPDASFKILPCVKERGMTYLIDDDDKMVFTKKDAWIAIEITNFKSGVLDIHERYSDLPHQKSPVVCDSKCLIDTEEFVDLMENYSFLVKLKVSEKEFLFSPIDIEGRQVVRINSRVLFGESDIPSEKLVMYVKYRCRNTCETHKRYGKNRQLVFKHQSLDNSLPKEEVFEVRVCEAPKRDLIKHRNKQRRSTSFDECSISPKRIKFEPAEQDVQIHTISDSQAFVIQESDIIPQVTFGITKDVTHAVEATQQNLVCQNTIVQSSEFQPSTIAFKMKTEADQKLVIRMINRLNGDIF